MIILDKHRASAPAVKSYNVAFANGNVNACTLDSDIVPPDRHWIVLCAEGLIRQTAGFNNGANANPNGGAAGLYLCPQGTKAPVGENLNGVGPGLLQTSTRPIEVDDNGQTTNIVIGADQYSSFVLTPQNAVVIPSQWFLRFIVNATTSGFAGLLTLTMQVIEEANC